MRRPKVSIGLPVYNGEAYLEETLRCILEQTFEDLELVISDNASTDGTQEISQRYARSDMRIKYYRCESNLGAAANYNNVFHLSCGKYFKWAASDDLFSSDLVERCVEVLEADDEIVLCYPKTLIIDDQGDFLRSYEDNLHLDVESPRRRFRALFASIGECNAVFGLIRSGVLQKTCLIGNYDGSDIAFLAELTLYGRFHEIPQRLFFRREHAAASSCNRDVQSQQEFFDPKTRGRPSMRQWKHHLAYLQSILRSPISFQDKASLIAYLARHAIWARRQLGLELVEYLRHATQLKRSSDRECN